MRKLFLSITTMCIALIANAQWVDNPTTNTFINGSHSEYGEIYQSRTPDGNFYVQFDNFVGGDFSPKLMYVTKEGVPMWDEPVYLGQSGSTMSSGVSMCATTDGCAVSHFTREEGGFGPYAYKVNPQGEIVWGPIATATVSENSYQCRTEIVADENGGVWASTTDLEQAIYVSHINTDGTILSSVNIPLGTYGGVQKMVASNDGGVLIAYQSYDAMQGWTMYDETIKVVKINAEGNIVNTQIMMNTTSIQGWKFMDIIPDGMGGGWCWIEHCGGAVDAFNIYVMHFSAEGNCTTYATNPLGVQISPTDESLNRVQGSGTYDVLTGDLILAFCETDAATQSNNSMRVVRVATDGALVNGEGGTVIVPTSTDDIGQFRIACAPDRSVTMLYCIAKSTNDGVIKALGTDPDFSMLWAKDFNTNPCVPSYKEAATGAYEYADGQYVLFFQDYRNEANGLYGQNIQKDGTMGPVVENPCQAPTGLAGEQYEDGDEYGAHISWTAATGEELSFNIYRGVNTVEIELIGNTTEKDYLDDLTGEEGGFIYVVRAVCENGESDPATTPEGEPYVVVNIIDHTGVAENREDNITVYQNGNDLIINGVNVENADIYNISGQLVKSIAENANVISASDLNAGMYLINIKANGMMISKKVIIK